MYKQVTKDVFEILSKHYKAEIRYYVDVTKNKRGNRTKEATARITVSEKRASNGNGGAYTGHYNDSGKVSTTQPREWKGKFKKDALIALGRSFGNTRQSAAIGTVFERVQRAVDEVYHKNAFTQFRRSTLQEKVRESTKLTGLQISPVISRMITAKWLRVVPEDATSPLDVAKANTLNKAKAVAALVS